MSRPWPEGEAGSGKGKDPVAGPAEARASWARPGPKTLNRLRLLLTLATLGAIAWYLHSRPRPDWSAFNLRWDLLAVSAACMPLLLWMRSHKWRILLRRLAPEITLGQAFRSYMGSMALALVTPGRVGELTRGLYLPHRAVQGWKGAGLVVIDSWTDFLAVLGWACLGWAVYLGPPGLLLGAALFAVAAPIPWWLNLAATVISRFPMPGTLRDWSLRCLPARGDVSGGDIAKAALLGLAAYGVEWLQLVLLIKGLIPLEAEVWRVAGIMAVVALCNSVQITLAGLGVREGLSMMLLAGLGIPPEAAVMAAFLQAVMLLFIPALAGLAVRPSALREESAPAASPFSTR